MSEFTDAVLMMAAPGGVWNRRLGEEEHRVDVNLDRRLFGENRNLD
jgi:hypothetical protein